MSTLYSLQTMNSPRDKTLIESTKYTRDISFLEQMLEFNEEMCLIELYETKGIYSSLLENNTYAINEGVIGTIIETIRKFIRAIIDFFKNIFTKGNIKKNSENSIGYLNSIVSMKDKINNYQSSGVSIRGEVIDYHYDVLVNIPLMYETYDKDANKIANEFGAISNDLDELVRNYSRYVDIDQLDNRCKFITNRAKSCQDLTNAAGALNTKYSGDAYKRTITTQVGTMEYFKEKANYVISKESNIRANLNKSQQSTSKDNIPDNIKGFIKSYQALEKLLANNEKLDDYKISIRNLVSACSALQAKFCRDYTKVLNDYYSYCNEALKYLKMKCEGFDKPSKEKTDNSSDYDEIEDGFGESFINSFDDAILVEFAEYDYDRFDILKRAMIEEAKIMSNPDIEDKAYEMYKLNEDVKTQLNNVYTKLIQSIKTAFNKFVAKMNDNNNWVKTKRYLDKYKDTILKNKVPEGTYTGKDFLNGIKRINDFEIPDANYTAIKGSLRSPYTVFQYFNNGKQVSAGAPEVQDGDETVAQVGNYFKAYFGCAGNDVNYDTATMEQNKEHMFNFVYNSRTLQQKVQKSIDNIEKLRTQAVRANGGVAKTSNPTEDGITKPQGQQAQQQQESYFSYLNNFELIMEEWKPAAQNTNQTNATGTNSQIGQMTAGINNANRPNDRVANNSTEYGQNNPGDQTENECINYARVATQILKAELSAIEFINNEIMKFFRYMVATYVQGETIANPANPPQQTAQPQQ